MGTLSLSFLFPALNKAQHSYRMCCNHNTVHSVHVCVFNNYITSHSVLYIYMYLYLPKSAPLQHMDMSHNTCNVHVHMHVHVHVHMHAHVPGMGVCFEQ